MNFKSLLQLTDHFKDEETCAQHYEQLRWPNGIVCPHCGVIVQPYRTKRGYKCREKLCHKKFSVRTGTIFENSKIPLRTWFAAIYLCGTHKKGISSVQLAIDLNVTQKTAWFILHRIREMLANQAPEILGQTNAVEVDESFVGGREKNRHYNKKRYAKTDYANDGTVYNKKKIVVGILDRHGKLLLKHVPEAKSHAIVPIIYQYVPDGTTIYTDESPIYDRIGRYYDHGRVNHSCKLYAAGECHTNSIENFWATLKRIINGTYHQVSSKHFDRYLQEIAARFNDRTLTQQQRFDKFLADSETYLPYKKLIAK